MRQILVSNDAHRELCELAKMLKESSGKTVTFAEVVDFVLVVANAVADAS